MYSIWDVTEKSNMFLCFVSELSLRILVSVLGSQFSVFGFGLQLSFPYCQEKFTRMGTRVNIIRSSMGVYNTHASYWRIITHASKSFFWQYWDGESMEKYP
jgi:hypothetical protein